MSATQDLRPSAQHCSRKPEEATLTACELIVAVDFAESNKWSGKNSFGEHAPGRSLHALDGPVNPYMVGLSMIARTMEVYHSHLVPCYGFGDVTTRGVRVFSFYPGNQPAMRLDSLLARYKEIAASMDLTGPTTFAPVIRQAMRDVYNNGMKYHILFIMSDGQISEECMEDTKKAIVEACAFPLSIVMIGVGDGPWDEMSEFDIGLPQRTWNNFHFFDFNQIFNWSPLNFGGSRERDFQAKAMAEIAPQYTHASKLTGEDKKAHVEHLLNDPSFPVVIDPPIYGGFRVRNLHS